jgi:hypothetical protein
LIKEIVNKKIIMNKKIHILHLVGNMALGGSSKLVKFNIEHTNHEKYNVSVCCLGSIGEYGDELIEKGYTIESFGM